MKTEIKKLRNLQKKMWESQYPGYPFQVSVVIDKTENTAYLNYYSNKSSLDKVLLELNNKLLYNVLSCNKITKQTWLEKQNLSTLDNLRNADESDFYIDNYLAAKLYLMIQNALYSPENKKKKFVFAYLDMDCEWTDTRVFSSLQEVEDYIKEYWTEE